MNGISSSSSNMATSTTSSGSTPPSGAAPSATIQQGSKDTQGAAGKDAKELMALTQTETYQATVAEEDEDEEDELLKMQTTVKSETLGKAAIAGLYNANGSAEVAVPPPINYMKVLVESEEKATDIRGLSLDASVAANDALADEQVKAFDQMIDDINDAIKQAGKSNKAADVMKDFGLGSNIAMLVVGSIMMAVPGMQLLGASLVVGASLGLIMASPAGESITNALTKSMMGPPMNLSQQEASIASMIVITSSTVAISASPYAASASAARIAAAAPELAAAVSNVAARASTAVTGMTSQFTSAASKMASNSAQMAGFSTKLAPVADDAANIGVNAADDATTLQQMTDYMMNKSMAMARVLLDPMTVLQVGIGVASTVLGVAGGVLAINAAEAKYGLDMANANVTRSQGWVDFYSSSLETINEAISEMLTSINEGISVTSSTLGTIDIPQIGV